MDPKIENQQLFEYANVGVWNWQWPNYNDGTNAQYTIINY